WVLPPGVGAKHSLPALRCDDLANGECFAPPWRIHGGSARAGTEAYPHVDARPPMAARPYAASRRVQWKLAPCPPWRPPQMRPPCASTASLRNARPSPGPLGADSRCTRVNFWKMRWRSASGTPGPVSLTLTVTSRGPGPACALTRTSPSAAEYLMAL